jgi:hypothetical protein
MVMVRQSTQSGRLHSFALYTLLASPMGGLGG